MDWAFSDKRMALSSQMALLQTYREKKAIEVVLTAGCFDGLHPGHLSLLRFCKGVDHEDIPTNDDWLPLRFVIVLLNTDESIAELKGPGRPLFPYEHREDMLCYLPLVSNVNPLHHDRLEEMIELVKPDIYVKGAEYEERGLPEREWVERWGGRIEFSPMAEGWSTTRTEIRLRGGSKGEPVSPPSQRAPWYNSDAAVIKSAEEGSVSWETMRQ